MKDIGILLGCFCISDNFLAVNNETYEQLCFQDPFHRLAVDVAPTDDYANPAI